ncbi:MAG TPA: RecQ family ATP-dependent DNA helicase, partial [Planctomycetota bacterium]|nr:RecQ family ATP-dependent DNA helicase [Planctomycetota bacterium]
MLFDTGEREDVRAAAGNDPPSVCLEELRGEIRRVWGHPSLRPLQAEAMEASLAGRDALVVLATGAGKSLCYQAPALVRPGLTAVVSPLISLMKDQIDALRSNGVPAEMLTSAQTSLERREVRARLAERRAKLLFVAPERLMLDGFLDELVRWGLSALVVDEAHCISHWGHDFRPEYRQIGRIRREHPGVPIQAFTATATPAVREDVVRQLGLCSPAVLIGSFDRPNLTYRFVPRADLEAQVLAVVRRHPDQAGIVYCLRRKDVDQLAARLAARGVSTLPYHAGLDAATRKENQERFLEESVQVVVATVAFGMGIDRADVRFVAHAHLPKGVEQFSQETGRAGRDGLPAECVMLYSAADYYGWKGLMERSAQEASDARSPIEAAGAAEIAEELAAAERSAAERSAGELEAALRRLSEMLRFATGATCRHRYLVEHFGQAWGARAGGCGACDVCLGELGAVEGADVLAQKILSCVVRVGQRFGSAYVADVLRGEGGERVRTLGHDQLSTFGLLRQHPAREIRHWIEQLVGLGHLLVAPGPYPTLYLSPSGVELLRGKLPVTLFEMPKRTRAARPRTSLASLAAEEGAPAPDEALFERLRALRRRL